MCISKSFSIFSEASDIIHCLLTRARGGKKFTVVASISESDVSCSKMSLPLTRYLCHFKSSPLLPIALPPSPPRKISYETFRLYIVMVEVRGSSGKTVGFSRAREGVSGGTGGGGGRQLFVLLHWDHQFYHMTQKVLFPVIRNT